MGLGISMGARAGSALKAFPTIAGTTQGGDAAVNNSKSVTLPSGIQAGDYIVLFLGFYSDSGVTGNLPSGYTNLRTASRARTYYRVCYKVAAGTESGTTVTVTANLNHFLGWSVRVIRGASAIDSAVTSANTETAPNAPSLSPSWGADQNLWIASANQYDATATQAAPSGYSSISQGAAASGGWDWSRVSTAWRQEGAATEDPPAFANAISGGATGAGWEAVTVAFKPE